jgi:glycine/D-amino acid oxidase-like deaminating enzyme
VKEYPYWLDTVQQPAASSQQPAVSSQEIPNRIDVAIVGAGYTGLSAARQVARAGATVVVFEAERIGFGASSRNAGQVLTGMKLDPTLLVARYGEARARRLFEVSLEAIDALERVIADENIVCEYAQVGHLQAAARPSHLSAFREEQALLARVFGHRVAVLSASEQRAELGTDAYHGVMVDERSAALNPAKYVDGLARAACRAGARIVTGVSVRRIDQGPAGWTLETSAGSFGAREVLLATNAYTSGAAPALRRRFIPIGSYIVVTEPLPRADAAAILPRRRTGFDSKNFLFYFRLTGDNRLLFGGRAEFSAPTEKSTRRAASILRDGVARVFPELASIRFDYAWGGRVAFTRDQMPHAGRLDGLHYAGGYCGHGVAMATHLGAIIGRRIAGEPIEHPLVDDRFPPIPLYRGTPWFLPLVGAYYKVMDWLR